MTMFAVPSDPETGAFRQPSYGCLRACAQVPPLSIWANPVVCKKTEHVSARQRLNALAVERVGGGGVEGGRPVVGVRAVTEGVILHVATKESSTATRSQTQHRIFVPSFLFRKQRKDVQDEGRGFLRRC